MKEVEYYRLKALLDRSKIRKNILSVLDESDKALRPTDLSKELSVERSNISTRLIDLREKELVKVMNPEDNRNRYYKITERGEKVLKEEL